MPPATRSEREEERRLNTRTLTIASVASASAAAVTSQLWIAGTWIAAALTPVLVALISEAMHRPTERIARAWTTEREAPSPRLQSTTRHEPAALSGTAGPVRVYSQTGTRTRLASRRRIAIGAVAATGAIAFVIGIVALTTVDLVSGGSVGKGSGRTTAFGGGGGGDGAAEQPERDTGPANQEAPAQEETAPSETPTTTSPPEEEQPSETAPEAPPAETPPGEPLPDSQPTP